MTEKTEEEILLVKEKGKNKLRVVSGLDEDGNLKSVPPATENEQDFMKIDKQGDVLENFFINFMRQAKDPYNFDFLKIDMKDYDRAIPVLEEMLKDPEANKEFIDPLRVNPDDFVKKQQEQQTQEPENQKEEIPADKAMDETRIDWEQVEQFVPRATLEESGWLKKLLNYEKVPEDRLINMQPIIGEVKIPIQARLSFREMPDGRIIGIPHPFVPNIPIDKPYLGHTFSEDDTKNLIKYGNLGRVVSLTSEETGETKPCYVSVDRLTNEIVGLPTEFVKNIYKIKGATLDETQQEKYIAGGRVDIIGMTSSQGNLMDRTIQINASTGKPDFNFIEQKQAIKQTEDTFTVRKPMNLEENFCGETFSDEDKNNLTQYGNLGRIAHLKNEETGKTEPCYVSIDKKTNELVGLGTNGITIPSHIKETDLNEIQQTGLAEANRTLIENMINKYGEPFNAILQVNASRKEFDFDFNTPQPLKQSQIENQNQEQSPQKIVYHKTLLGQEITSEIIAVWDAGKAFYMDKMTDKDGKPIKPCYVRPNHEKGKFDFLKWNPDKKRAKEVIPANELKTQVTINSEGKTNGATKHLKEPLQQEQNQPTERQQKEVKKTKGIRR